MSVALSQVRRDELLAVNPMSGFNENEHQRSRISVTPPAFARRSCKHMATITFLIDSKSLPKGGSSISTPKDVGHPQFLLNGTLQTDPNFVVPIKAAEKVVIYTVEAKGVPNVVMAPCGIIAHSFKNEALTPAIMKDPMLQPIDTPNFDMQLG